MAFNFTRLIIITIFVIKFLNYIEICESQSMRLDCYTGESTTKGDCSIYIKDLQEQCGPGKVGSIFRVWVDVQWYFKYSIEIAIVVFDFSGLLKNEKIFICYDKANKMAHFASFTFHPGMPRNKILYIPTYLHSYYFDLHKQILFTHLK